MSCQKNATAFANRIANGITRATSLTANTFSKMTYVVGTAVVYALKKRKLLWKTTKKGNVTFLYGSSNGKEISRKAETDILEALKLVKRRVGKHDVRTVIIADEFAFYEKTFSTKIARVKKKGPITALSPFIIGNMYLKAKQNPRTAAKGRAFLNYPEQIFIKSNALPSLKYVAIHEAIHQIPRTHNTHMRQGKAKEESLIQLITDKLYYGNSVNLSLKFPKAKDIPQNELEEAAFRFLVRELGIRPGAKVKR